MCRIELLEKKRLIKGLSYTEIAKQLGIHKVTVSRTLRGETMKSRTVKLLADSLRVEMESLVQYPPSVSTKTQLEGRTRARAFTFFSFPPTPSSPSGKHLSPYAVKKAPRGTHP